VLRRFAAELRDAGSTLKIVASTDRVISQLDAGGLTAIIGERNVYRGSEWVGETLRAAYDDARDELRER
jgi:SulP family sulfate permease